MLNNRNVAADDLIFITLGEVVVSWFPFIRDLLLKFVSLSYKQWGMRLFYIDTLAAYIDAQQFSYLSVERRRKKLLI